MPSCRILSPDERDAARDLFEQAIERDLDADAWIAQAEVDDRVRAEVLSLLACHRQAGSFLAAPAADHLFAMSEPLFAVFTFAIGLGLALARVVLEPVTTRAAFPEADNHARN